MRSLFLQAFLLQLLVRSFLILQYPHNFAFDGFQRWAGKEQLLVRDWMPAAQFFIYCANALGFDILGTKFILCVVASFGVASTSLIVAHLFDQKAGHIFIGFSFFLSFLTWSSTLYQEGTFLALSMSSIALVLYLPKNKLWIADIVAGSVALSRYEGWPFVLLYLFWRKDLKASIALWGMFFWLGIKLLALPSFAPSPISYSDWEGLSERFILRKYLENIISFVTLSSEQGVVWIWFLGLFGFKKAFQKDFQLSLLLFCLLCSQLLAILGWIAGLETVIHRMYIIPTFLLAIFGSGLSRQWLILPLFSFGFAFIHTQTSLRYTQFKLYQIKHEILLVEKMNTCLDCRFLVVPNKELGTRNRHDSCEIIQGISNMMHPNDFTCELWKPEIDRSLFTHTAQWISYQKGYHIRPHQP